MKLINEQELVQFELDSCRRALFEEYGVYQCLEDNRRLEEMSYNELIEIIEN